MSSPIDRIDFPTTKMASSTNLQSVGTVPHFHSLHIGALPRLASTLLLLGRCPSVSACSVQFTMYVRVTTTMTLLLKDVA